MGEIVVNVELQNALDHGMVLKGLLPESDVHSTAVDAVVDTGALMLALPEDVVERLDIPVVDRRTVVYADGRREDRPVAGPLTVHLGGRSAIANCLVMPEGTDVLIGQMVLEGMDLMADCRNRTLVPRLGTPEEPLLRL